MTWPIAVVIFAAVFAATLAGTGALVAILNRRAILDRPNPRSSHQVPTPRGGGIAVMGALLPAWALIALLAPQSAPEGAPLAVAAAPMPVFLVLLCALALAAVSWLDDLKGLSPLERLLLQFAAVAVGLSTLPGDASGEALVFQGLLPPLADRAAAAFAWVWFLNLFNFMDGIDGITGVEAGSIGAGIFLLALVTGSGADWGLYGLATLAAAVGFLRWNWHPARIFLGDVGSVPLGFLLGWLLLGLAATGQWAAALILPLYYLADATITLLRRLLRGERVWQAHAEHFYQHAVRKGLHHGSVCRLILVANLGLIALAVAAQSGLSPAAPVLCVTGAALIVGGLLFHLGRAGLPRSS